MSARATSAMGFPRTLSLMVCQMILVISSPSSSTTGFLTLIFLIPAWDAILYCPICVYKLDAAVGALFAVVRRGLENWADFAAVWEAKQRVAKLQVCRRGSRATEVAARKAAGAVVAGLMANRWCGITSERQIQGRPEVVSFATGRGSDCAMRRRYSADRTTGLVV